MPPRKGLIERFMERRQIRLQKRRAYTEIPERFKRIPPEVVEALKQQEKAYKK